MKSTTIKLEISGMTCDHCATGIEKLLYKNEGIKEANVSYPKATCECSFDPSKTSKEEIVNTINETKNYKVKTVIENENKVSNGNHFDLIIIGGGSAAFSAAIKAESLGLSTLMINGGLDFGGTCVNVGCVPSKNLIRAGETAYHAKHSNFSGVKPKGVDIDFTQIIKDKKKLVATLQQKKYMDVVSDFKYLTMLKGWATFIDNKTIIVDGRNKYTAIKFIIATGAATSIPNIEGMADIAYLTNISLFNLEQQHKSLIVLGGGYIALEIAQAYQRLGTKVTLLQRSKQVLSHLTADVSEELIKQLRLEGMEVHTGLHFQKVFEENGSTKVAVSQNGTEQIFEAEKLVIATGTKPNTSQLGLENIGLKLNKTGHILVNEKMETNLSNIYAVGDATNTPAFVYTAALEGKIAVENAFSGTENKADYSSLPWVVFTDPQVAGAGLDEAQAEAKGIPFEVSKLELKDVPRAIAANDTRGFIKLIRNTETDKLIGARIVAPEGGELIQQLSMAIKYNITIKELAESFYPYLTLGEGIKLAAITFGKDVSKLSCCAS
ncbi:MAG: mercury(II) reductase [Lutibacter sp.]|nr:mercury(II) reductase [Lutibacter sp.]